MEWLPNDLSYMQYERAQAVHNKEYRIPGYFPKDFEDTIRGRNKDCWKPFLPLIFGRSWKWRSRAFKVKRVLYKVIYWVYHKLHSRESIHAKQRLYFAQLDTNLRERGERGRSEVHKRFIESMKAQLRNSKPTDVQR